MFLHQDSNRENLNDFPPKDQLFQGKYGSTFSLECYYCHEWGHISKISLKFLLIVSMEEVVGVVEVHALAEDPALNCYRPALVLPRTLME